MSDLLVPATERPPGLERFDRVVAIGVGARTRTYAATHGPGSPFAVRVLRTGVDPARVRRIFAGGGTAVHGRPPPHLVTEGPIAYFVAPLIIGDPLARRARRPLPPRLATRIVIEVASALGTRVHGDLHPRHILFTGDGRAHLIDADPAAPGPPGYSAPERRHGRPPTLASEIYALGVLWHELVTGRAPDVPLTRSMPPGATGLAPPMQALLRGLLRPEPRDRRSTPASLIAALEALMGDLPGPDLSVRAWLGEADWRRPGFWRDAWRALTEGGGEPTLVEGALAPLGRPGPELPSPPRPSPSSPASSSRRPPSERRTPASRGPAATPSPLAGGAADRPAAPKARRGWRWASLAAAALVAGLAAWAILALRH